LSSNRADGRSTVRARLHPREEKSEIDVVDGARSQQ
jgi:hypothetical protein